MIIYQIPCIVAVSLKSPGFESGYLGTQIGMLLAPFFLPFQNNLKRDQTNSLFDQTRKYVDSELHYISTSQT